MPAPQQIIDLVNRFERNYESYTNANYNETQTRREFIDPFFEALGWDISNRLGYAEAYKDVVHEYSQKTTDSVEAPDYLFRIGGTRKFFVEAKKPNIKLADDISPAFQLRRYAWTAKLPLSILTDFEELAVYDCRIKPNKNDKPSTARINYYTYKDYIDKWDEIESVFSKDAVLKGSFDKFAESKKGKRGTAEVDDEFLKEIEHWRELLAKNIALRNSKLSNRELNYSVQKIIDRIIFLRICEDRGIEEYGQLLNHLNGTNVYKRLLQIFTRADEKYNSGLFHFETEKDRPESPDEITPDLNIDDKTLKDIIRTLYYPDSPYEFSVLPADILGHVYEQFLGKVIRLTPAHQAKIEEKPEVKKAGGVYYTPTYIVDYIVKNTLGKLLTDDKKPNHISKLKILDPACGSGSFLIVAYQYLLDWHLKYYINSDPDKHAQSKNPPVYSSSNGEWKLTTSERKRILLNNIYGVDIDPQAVEVTKLSLLLKVLEGETEETLSSQFKFFRERALPDLGSNIKCGNSLIGPDFYQQTELNLITDEERMRINVFDWHKEFPEVFNDSPSASSGQGFDVVIGNPPYGATFTQNEMNYLRNKFTTTQGEIDSYTLFLETSLTLLKSNGFFSMILPDTWLTNYTTEIFRKWILFNFSLLEIIHLNEYIFNKATVDPVIVTMEKLKPHTNHIVSIRTIPKNHKLTSIDSITNTNYFNQEKWLSNHNAQIKIYLTNELEDFFVKLENNSIKLEKLLDYKAGCKPYEVGKGNPAQTRTILDEKPFTSFKQFSKDWKKLIRGNDVKRYCVKIKKPEWINYGDWLAAPRDPNIFQGERLLVQAIRNPSLKNRIIVSFENEELISRINVYTLLKKDGVDVHYYYLLGILNSALMNWFLKRNYGLHTYIITGLLQLPIRIINFSAKKEKEIHDAIVHSASKIINLNKSLIKANTPQEKESLQRQIDATDREIDRLVYELYGLTEEEIKIVESIS